MKGERGLYDIKTIVIWLLRWRRGIEGEEKRVSACALMTAPFVGVLSSKVLCIYIIKSITNIYIYIFMKVINRYNTWKRSKVAFLSSTILLRPFACFIMLLDLG